MTMLAASGIGLVAAPMAFGQIVIPIGGPIGISTQSAGVTNSGSASANTGGNSAVGNSSSNTATATAPAGGLVDVPVTVGAPTNTSDGNATVSSGPATAVGNQSGTAVGQSNGSGAQVNSFLANQQNQSAGVTNAGAAGANSGGNTAVGNDSTNAATVNQNVSGGLLGVGVTLGGPTNNSTGNATINSGAANAVGNNATTEIGQGNRLGVGGAGGSAAACGAGRFGSFQNAGVSNQGQASANTGNNTAIGNNSTNNAASNVAGTGQTVSGGLLGVGITIGGPVNNSTGTAVINTGPATATGNNSVTDLTQSQGCPQLATLGAPGPRPIVVTAAPGTVRPTALARTGLDAGDLGMIAGALLGAGVLLVSSQRRRLITRTAAVPMAGFGLGLGDNGEWDRLVR